MTGNSSWKAMIMHRNRHCEPTGRTNARPMTGSAKQSIAPNDGLWIASARSLSSGPPKGGTRWLLAMMANAAGPCGGLVSQSIGDPLPDLILDLGRARAGNDGGGTCALMARPDQTQNPSLAIGVIEIAAAVTSGHRRSNSGHLIFCIHHSGGFQIGGEKLSLGVDIRIDMMRDGAGVSADADAAIERRIAEPDGTLFLALVQHLPEAHMVARICPVADGLFEREILAPVEIKQGAHRRFAIGAGH